MPKVFIIVLNFNGLVDTLECLRSLKKINYTNFQIVVVDNDSNDGSCEKIPADWPEVVFIENGANLGFAGGNNSGIKYALENGADYILLLNNDTIVGEDFLTKLIEVAESDKDIGMLVPQIYFYDHPGLVWYGGGKVERFMTRGVLDKYMQVDSSDNYQSGEYFETDYITGTAMLVKRKVIEEIGLMEEDYFLYFEDVDWSLRAKKVGFKLAVVPCASVWHKVSRSAQPGSSYYIYYHSRNGLVCAWRHGGVVNKIGVIFLSVFIFIKQIIKLTFFPTKRRWAKAVMRGIKDFYTGERGPV